MESIKYNKGSFWLVGTCKHKAEQCMHIRKESGVFTIKTRKCEVAQL